MKLHVFSDKRSMGVSASECAAGVILAAVRERGAAQITLATGASQFEFLESLVAREIDWGRVSAFHLDEYIGLPVTHPASFRRYLRERFAAEVPSLHQFHEIDGEAGDPTAECQRLGGLMRAVSIDVACIGIGENGHIAFNDPPADFDVNDPFIVVDLDRKCREQQTGEGWFETVSDVPAQAISMSVREIMRAKHIVCTVPDERKAIALRNALEGEVTPEVPASILQRHPNCHLFADEPAASLLTTIS